MSPQDMHASISATSGITVMRVEEICARAANIAEAFDSSYRPTDHQVLFFTLSGLLKKENRERCLTEMPALVLQQRQDRFTCLEEDEVQNLATIIVKQLKTWGECIGKLQKEAEPRLAQVEPANTSQFSAPQPPGTKQKPRRDEEEWEMLRVQMDVALRRYECAIVHKEDALNYALINLMRMVDAMPTAVAIESAVDALAFFVEQQEVVSKVYAFDLPFYEYAKRTARNKLIDILRNENRRNKTQIGLDGLSDILARHDPDHFETEEQTLQLRLQLTKLFALIKEEMQARPTRQNVVWHTLAARAQYWLALDMTELSFPNALPPTPNASDAVIAATLNTNENSVRVHRNQAKQQIYTEDAASGSLLERLLDPALSRSIDDWPAI